MIRIGKTRQLIVFAATLAFVCGGVAQAGSLLILAADPSSNVATTQMQNTGLFSSVTYMDIRSVTPTLAQLSPYSAIYVQTDYSPYSATALGNVLDQYYALGGKALTMTQFTFAGAPVSGAVMTGSDDAFVVNGSSYVTSTGHLVATAPSDPIFTGINLGSVTYTATYTANVSLAAGATLLASDGTYDMIARSANGIIDFNMYPGNGYGTNQAFYNLLANTLTQTQAPVPEPSSWLLLVTVGGIAGFALKRRFV